MNYYIDHDVLGRVIIRTNDRARSFIARWKCDRVYLTVPTGTPYNKVVSVLDDMSPGLIKKRPAQVYAIGSIITVAGLEVEIATQSHRPDMLLLNYNSGGGPKARLLVGDNIDINSPLGINLVSRGFKAVADYYAPSILLPRAREIASRLGLKVTRWSIGRGDRRLGCCNSRGEISLSRICVYLSEELRDYVVCHELAHLSEMNHSPRFHELCNRYVGGREEELERRLKAYPWPIVR